MLRSIFKQIIRWACWDVDIDYALRSAYWDVNLDHVVRSTVVLLYWDQVRSAWCWDSGEIWKIFKSNVEIWKLRHLFKSSGEIKDVCWDEVLRCIFRSGVEICMPRCIFKSCVEIIMLRHMRCALTWVLRVRYWSTCPSLSGLRMLPSPPPASSRGLTALMSVNQEPTQHYYKVSRDLDA